MALALLWAASSTSILAQDAASNPAVNGIEFLNWHNEDPSADGKLGTSTEKAYEELLKGRKAHPVVVAVIDSGTDIFHEDLKDNIWVNEDEVPGNGIDDDKNGYIDDVHGWSFLGNTEGENINAANMEVTRIYVKYQKEFEGKEAADIPSNQKDLYDFWLTCKEEMESQQKAAKEEMQQIAEFSQVLATVHYIITQELGTEEYGIEEIKAIESDSEPVTMSRDLMIQLHEDDFKPEDIIEWQKQVDTKIRYRYNPEYRVRELIIGDDPDDTSDRNYGCNDVKGPRSDHGTHVAGIIGAVRGNGIGMDGVANNVKIMAVRAVPDGDELDKDVANAIRYAVENGAQIINMSFGKSISPQEEAVEDAIRFAESKGVLLVHGAGNDAENNDKNANHPSPYFESGGKANNWIEVGAIQQEKGDVMMATFTNYGRKKVDIFAPGVDIFSLEPENTYKNNSGTSMASPVVAGVAAILLSYFPDLSASEVRDLILSSAIKPKIKVIVPGTANDAGKSKRKCFKKMSSTGGVISTYAAVKKALDKGL